MRGIQFEMLQYISRHIDTEYDFYRKLGDLTKEEAMLIYIRLKAIESSAEAPLIIRPEYCD